MFKNLLPTILAAACMLSGTSAADVKPVDFVTDVKPILTSRCIGCHHSGALFGELNLENHALAFKKRAAGPVILPGKPDSSPLHYVLKLPPKDVKAMPPTGHRIPDREMKVIYDWIKQGAHWPEGAAGVVTPARND